MKKALFNTTEYAFEACKELMEYCGIPFTAVARNHHMYVVVSDSSELQGDPIGVAEAILGQKSAKAFY